MAPAIQKHPGEVSPLLKKECLSIYLIGQQNINDIGPCSAQSRFFLLIFFFQPEALRALLQKQKPCRKKNRKRALLSDLTIALLGLELNEH